MLTRLIKFEMKAMGRIMLPLYAIMLAASGVIAVWLRTGILDNPLVHLLIRRAAAVVMVLFVMFALATALIMALLVVQRFYKNLLGTEGYLMFTLPVTTAENIISKGITSLIWIVLGIIAGGISGMLVVIGSGGIGMNEFFADLGDLFHTVFNYAGNGSLVLGGVLFILLMMLGILKSLAEVYAAAAVGQLWNDHKLLGGILAYIGFSIIETLFMQLPGLSKVSEIMEQMLDGTGVSMMIRMNLIIAVGLVIYYVIAWALLDKKLNLE